MKVRKIGQLNDNHEISGKIPASVADILTNLTADEASSVVAQFPITIGQGYAARTIMLEIFIPDAILNSQLSNPINLSLEEKFRVKDGEYLGVFMFRNQIFMTTTDYLEESSEEEAVLLIKKQVYSEDNKLKRLRQEVEVMERVVNQKGFVRTAIPESVKLLVYTRDEGKCVRCGSMENLHFDHIIPVSKGGGNSESNIQLLCDYCNLQKSDKIAF